MENDTGFLRAEGRGFVDGQGRSIQLKGAALGNWLLLEGYMWGLTTSRCNRERLIEEAFRQLAGREYADTFFPRYRRAFVSREDIRLMAALGYNSVRLPFNWRHFMYEGPGIRFKDEGFERLDSVIEWCREFGIYAILDMHGAPGGQTGSNIDDGVDNVPRLFIDADSWDKALALWEKIAIRYCDEKAVGGYDLLNEPLRTVQPQAPIEDVDYLIPALSRFYDECVRRIRAVDQNHMLSIEGAHWARDTRVFDHLYDPNMCIHFHAYWTLPQMDLIEPYLRLSEQWNVPLWLGETGENTPQWFTTLFPLLDELGISWNFWQWKKGVNNNSNYIISQPEGWQTAVEFVMGGPHPGFEAAQRMLEEWLVNCRIENCRESSIVAASIMRRPGIAIPGIAYMLDGHSTGVCQDRPFRAGDGMRHIPRFGTAPEPNANRSQGNASVRTDRPWHIYDLLLDAGEYASWMLRPTEGARVTLKVRGLRDDTVLRCEAAGRTVQIPLVVSACADAVPALALPEGECTLKISCVHGAAALESISMEA